MVINNLNFSIVKDYLRRNHIALIGIIIGVLAIVVAIIVVPWGIFIQKELNESNITNEYYYVTRTTIKDLRGLEVANCWVHSISSNRSDAYRCVHENIIYDPCFKNDIQNSSIVACPDTPNGSEEVFIFNSEIDETASKMFNLSNEERIPWHVILSNGSGCRFITGATDVVADKRRDYGCYDNQAYLQLPIEKSGQFLKIRCYNPKRQAIEFCTIKEAWF